MWIFSNLSRPFSAPMIAVAAICLSSVLCVAAHAADSSNTAADGNPGAPRLLPSDTLVYVRLDNADELRNQMAETSIGRMLDDPKLRPFANEFYATAKELFDRISDNVGVNLDELLAIPHGQVAFAIHPAKPMDEGDKPEVNIGQDDDEDEIERRKERIRRRELYSFGITAIIDAGDNIEDLMNIVSRFEQQITKGGFNRRVRKMDNIEVTRFLPPRPGQLPFDFFEQEGTLVFGGRNSAAHDLMNHWNCDSVEPTLADNETIGTIIERCSVAEEKRPQ